MNDNRAYTCIADCHFNVELRYSQQPESLQIYCGVAFQHSNTSTLHSNGLNADTQGRTSRAKRPCVKTELLCYDLSGILVYFRSSPTPEGETRSAQETMATAMISIIVTITMII